MKPKFKKLAIECLSSPINSRLLVTYFNSSMAQTVLNSYLSMLQEVSCSSGLKSHFVWLFLTTIIKFLNRLYIKAVPRQQDIEEKTKCYENW